MLISSSFTAARITVTAAVPRSVSEVQTTPASGRLPAPYQINEKLQQLGWTEGRNVQIQYRWFAADPEHMKTYAAELVALGPDVVLAASEQAVFALQHNNPGIRIVFVQIDDPVGAGFIASMAHPAGNITGFTPFEFSMGSKMLETLKQIAPRITTVATALNPDRKSVV